MRTRKIILLAGLVFSAFVASGEQIINNTSPAKSGSGLNLTEVMIPVLIAVLGYLGKSVYEIYVNRQKRKREQLENQLKYFYWPIYIRLQKNADLYRIILKFKPKKENESIDAKISRYVQKEVILKTHEEIIDIIITYRHLAETDYEFETLTNQYITHVSIQRGFYHAEMDEYTFIFSEALYPLGIDNYFHDKTIALQKKLERLTF